MHTKPDKFIHNLTDGDKRERFVANLRLKDIDKNKFH